MTTKSFLCVDLAQVKIVSKYFDMISLDIEHRKDVSLHYPSSVSLADCQTFLNIIIQSKPILPKLLLALHASSVFIIRPFEKRDVLCYGVWRPSVHNFFRFRLTPPTVYIRSS